MDVVCAGSVVDAASGSGFGVATSTVLGVATTPGLSVAFGFEILFAADSTTTKLPAEPLRPPSRFLSGSDGMALGVPFFCTEAPL